MFPGIAATSPTSRTLIRSHAFTPWNWLDGLSRTDMSRTADGPKRWPGLKLAAVSNGIPTIAASGTPESVAAGRRMNERRPVKRGFCVALGSEDRVTGTPTSKSQTHSSLRIIHRHPRLAQRSGLFDVADPCVRLNLELYLAGQAPKPIDDDVRTGSQALELFGEGT